jgi:hypothetical protein
VVWQVPQSKDFFDNDLGDDKEDFAGASTTLSFSTPNIKSANVVRVFVSIFDILILILPF